MAGRRYKCSFQCPLTGCDVEANYCFGKLYLKPSRNSVHYEHADDSTIQKTEDWCSDRTGRRFSSADAAANYLLDEGCYEADVCDLRYGSE